MYCGSSGNSTEVDTSDSSNDNMAAFAVRRKETWSKGERGLGANSCIRKDGRSVEPSRRHMILLKGFWGLTITSCSRTTMLLVMAAKVFTLPFLLILTSAKLFPTICCWSRWPTSFALWQVTEESPVTPVESETSSPLARRENGGCASSHCMNCSRYAWSRACCAGLKSWWSDALECCSEDSVWKTPLSVQAWNSFLSMTSCSLHISWWYRCADFA